MTPENRVKDAIQQYIRDQRDPMRTWCVKIHADGIQGRGTLDLVGAFRGVPFLVEVKRAAGGVTSPAQMFLIDRARAGGYVSGSVSSLDDFRKLFEAD